MAEQFAEKPQSSDVLEENISFEHFVKRYEGQSVEWHAGKVVKKMSNNEKHQLILGFLYGILSYMLAIKPKGRVYLAGLPMFIADTQAAREPDLMIILEDKFENVQTNRLMGAADIAVEIVSPGSNSVDRGPKFDEYEKAGVQEYWLIDPQHQEVFVYALNDKGSYRNINPKNKVISYLLPDFSLDIEILWQDELPAGPALMELINKMLK